MKPLAFLSFLSGSYVIFHLLARRRDKLKRMYHRIILAMNMCVVPYAIADFVGTWAMLKGTPYRLGAAGNQTTCDVQGFFKVIVFIAVPYYYSSLSVYSCFAVRNSFKEENYRYIEKWIHLGALFVTLPFATYSLKTEFINPGVTVCFSEEFPKGCALDPDIPCERGGDTSILLQIYGLISMAITFVIPPVALLVLRHSIKRASLDEQMSLGKKKVIESYRKKALKELTAQSALYLFSLWITHILGYMSYGYELATGVFSYDITIVGNCLASFQGVILLFVYFWLEGKKRTVVCDPPKDEAGSHQVNFSNAKLTVADIQERAKHYIKSSTVPSTSSRFSFHIFDGEVDESSPWAKFLNPDDYSEDDDDFEENDDLDYVNESGIQSS